MAMEGLNQIPVLSKRSVMYSKSCTFSASSPIRSLACIGQGGGERGGEEGRGGGGERGGEREGGREGKEGERRRGGEKERGETQQYHNNYCSLT